MKHLGVTILLLCAVLFPKAVAAVPVGGNIIVERQLYLLLFAT